MPSHNVGGTGTSMSFGLQKDIRDGIPVLRISGAVMELNIAQFSRALRTTAQQSPTAIVLDLTDTEYLDSQAVGILVFFHSTLQSDGQRLVIVNRNPHANSYMRNLFKTTGLSKVLPVLASFDYDTVNATTTAPKGHCSPGGYLCQ